MAENTGIEWTHHTFNPWWGCTKISPACDHCYAERHAHRLAPFRVLWGVDADRRTFGDKHWHEPVKWNAKAAAAGERHRVFCASMGDVFDNKAPADQRDRLWDLIRATPSLDWLLLTKRIGNAYTGMLPMDFCGKRYPNVWLGITVVNQAEADRDIPKLLALNANVRFLSIEPMLGPVDLTDIALRRGTGDEEHFDALHFDGDADDKPELGTATLDWVIAGGESGPQARPSHPDWFRSLRDQCAGAGVPFLFKQWGEWTPGENVERQRGTVDTAFLYEDGWHVYPLNLTTDHGHIDDQPDLYRVGKRAAGRLLDGVVHDGYPHA